MNKEILFQNNKVFYRVIGTGKPVLLVHGFGEDGEVWQNQVAFLQDKFQLIIPDLPGSGRSSMDLSTNSGPWTMDRFAEMIKGIADQESLKTFTLIGHSMGGYITLAFAEKYPSYLNGFALFHSTGKADSEEKKEVRKKGIAFIREHGAFEFLKTSVPNLFSAISRDERRELVDEFVAGLSNFSPQPLVSYYEAMMQRPDRTNVLKQTGNPVLFIMGEYDNAVPLNDGLQQCHLPEKSYIHILHQSGHMGMLEEADKSSRMLEEFLLQISKDG